MTASTENGVPPQIQNLMDGLNDHHHVLFWLRWVPTVVIGVYILQRYVTALVNRPHFTKQDIVYQEYFASGGSNKNILIKMGGANGCVRLVVTQNLLWVTSWFPFSLIAAGYDLEHVIPLRSIQSIEGKKRFGVQSLVLTYADDVGKSHSLRLKPRNTQEFLDALETSSVRSGTMIPTANVTPEEQIPTLGVALKKYWHHLLVVGLLPTVLFVSSESFHVPFPMFIPVFFGTMIYGAWPTITKRVPFTYGLVMGAVWMGGGIVGGMVTALISSLIKAHHS